MAKNIQNEYRPYLKESLYCFVLDMVLISLIIVLFVAVSFWELAIIIPIIYLVFELFFNYKMALLIFIERRYYKPTKCSASIKSMDTEWSASGHFDSIIGELYPNSLEAGRYKFMCITADDERLKVRTVMAGKKEVYIGRMLREGKLSNVQITYGPVSKIIFEITALNNKGKIIDRISFFDNRF